MIAIQRDGKLNKKMLLRLTKEHMNDIDKAAKKAKISKMAFVRRAIERQVAMQMRRSK